MKKENWIWSGHGGHFILQAYCRFRLNTYVGGYIVSTVGEYVPDAPIREIFAKSRQIELQGQGDAREADYMRKIGAEDLHYNGFKYETMVFKAKKGDTACCPWVQESGTDVDMECYKTADEATKGHMKMCLKWSKKT